MRSNSFNILHVAVALLVVIVIVALLLPTIGSRHPPGLRMQNSTQLRGIHQGMVMYANSNKKWFPGISKAGESDRVTVEQRFQILVEENYIPAYYAISPLETGPMVEWGAGGGPVTSANYSYAMLQIPEAGGRRAEWSQTLNSQAVVLSDRNTGTPAKPASIHIGPGEAWAGSVLRNDNSVWFEEADVFETRYGEGEPNGADRLFESAGTDDALLIHAGN